MRCKPYLKYFLLRRSDGNFAFDCVGVFGDKRDATIIEKTEGREDFERWWSDEDKIEACLPPDPYDTWSDFFGRFYERAS